MNGEAANLMWIKTPEGVAFALPLASPLLRFLAWMVDGLIIGGMVIMLGMLLGVVGVVAPDFARALHILGWFALSIGYAAATEWFLRGQTYGKKILRLRVVDADGLRLHFHQVLLRNLLRLVDSLPFFYLVGGLVSLLSPRYQRLGDLAGNTVVIRIPRLTKPQLDQLIAGKFNSLRRYPHLVGRLRQRVSPAEAALALQAVLRREELVPARRLELFAGLARHFAQKAPFPPEATDGLTDEQFVRNVVDVLYRSEAAAPAAPATASR